MKFGKIKLASICLLTALSFASSASLVVSDSIFHGDFDDEGYDDDVSVSWVDFYVTEGSLINFDVLAAESLFGQGVDLNGDGDITAFDAKFVIYDQNLTTLIFENDHDLSGQGVNDGTVNYSDPYGTAYFADAGYYRLGLGLADFTYDEFVQGFQDDAFLFGNMTLNQHYNYADWQLTMTVIEGSVVEGPIITRPEGIPPDDWVPTGGDGEPIVSEVPAPTSLSILALGLVAAGVRRNKSIKKEVL